MARDALVGPAQVAVADVHILAHDFSGTHGHAQAIGERIPVAELCPETAVKLAIGEAITNLCATMIDGPQTLHMRMDWHGCPTEVAALQTMANTYAQTLGLEAPIIHQHHALNESPAYAVVTIDAPIKQVRQHRTPVMQSGQTTLVALNLSTKQSHLGGTTLAKVMGQTGGIPAKVCTASTLKHFIAFMVNLHGSNRLLSYHDRSDGGLLSTLCEMAFASQCGLIVDLKGMHGSALASLFHEGLGVVLQVKTEHVSWLLSLAKHHKLDGRLLCLGHPTQHPNVAIHYDRKPLISEPYWTLYAIWHATSEALSTVHFERLNGGQGAKLFQTPRHLGALHVTAQPLMRDAIKPAQAKVALLRDVGSHGAYEMADAWQQAGFECVDVHVHDLLDQRINLADFNGLCCVSGTPFNDHPSPALASANALLNDPYSRQMLSDFFARSDTFALGTQNGAQLLFQLRQLIAGTEHWPQFIENESQRHEHRWVRVKVSACDNLFLKGMADSHLPVIVSHAQGRAHFENHQQASLAMTSNSIALHYLDENDAPSTLYPDNPDGSWQGATGFSALNGRVLALMPVIERCVRGFQHHWNPRQFTHHSPWQRMFDNANLWVHALKRDPSETMET